MLNNKSILTFLTLLITLLISKNSNAQLVLPKGFKCESKPSDRTYHSQSLSNGRINFLSYTWGHEGFDAKETREFIEKTYNIKLQKTKDGLYWGTAPIFYIIIDGVMEYKVESNINNKEFKYYSTWLLKNIRLSKAMGNPYPSFSTYNGGNCFLNYDPEK
jgi:hypothetical protein